MVSAQSSTLGTQLVNRGGMGRPTGDDGAFAELFEPLPRVSPVADLARRIIDYVSSGELKPGTRLPSERDLAQSLRVGRSTVREAIAALDLLGLLEVRQGAGTFVKGDNSDLLPDAISWGLILSKPRTHHLVEARQEIEAVTARLAAQRASPEGVRRLRSRYEQMERARDNPARFVSADIAFHLEVASLADNSALADILRSVRVLLEEWIRRATDGSSQVCTTLAEHRAVLDAIASGNPELARAAMSKHLTDAGERLKLSLGAGETGRSSAPRRTRDPASASGRAPASPGRSRVVSHGDEVDEG